MPKGKTRYSVNRMFAADDLKGGHSDENPLPKLFFTRDNADTVAEKLTDDQIAAYVESGSLAKSGGEDSPDASPAKSGRRTRVEE